MRISDWSSDVCSSDLHGLSTRGRVMMRGLNMESGDSAQTVISACFERGLIIETSGAHDEIVKVLAPLTIEDAVLTAGLDLLEQCVSDAFSATYAVAAESGDPDIIVRKLKDIRPSKRTVKSIGGESK